MTDLLANPIWHSLSTLHSHLAKGNGLAKRYPEVIGPLAGISHQSTECWEALKDIVPPGDHCVLFLNERIHPENGLKLVSQFPIEQMLCESPSTSPPNDVDIEKLGEEDVDEMMALAALTEPGPFRQHTIRLGGYVGIHDKGRLAAMAGQRTAIPGYREVSAVCTHPNYRGKGYAAALVCSVMNEIARRRELPYLHVRQDNVTAIRLYTRLGFRITRTLHCTIVKISNGA
jgi:predicted GNAT family acetyltransferase